MISRPRRLLIILKLVAKGQAIISGGGARMPFPVPWLSVRIIGEVTEEKLDVVRAAIAIVEEELVEQFAPWQTFAALIEKGTGVKGDNRVHGWIIAVRAVSSRDRMTAEAMELPWEVLKKIEFE